MERLEVVAHAMARLKESPNRVMVDRWVDLGLGECDTGLAN
ncbi:MAG: hypothetical protein AAGD22_02770 [Verrucomicrobiota bacterium]